MIPPELMNAVVWYAVFVFSTVCHEFAHAWVANRLGDPTARQFITLNPLPHIQRSPFGMVLLPFLLFFVSGGNWMFGYASVPVNMSWALSQPRRFALSALVGPLTNLALVLVGVLLMALLIHVGAPLLGSAGSAGGAQPLAAASRVVGILIQLNLILFCFNIIPLPSFDGGNALAFFIPREHLRSYFELIWNPMLRLLGLLMAWILVFPALFGGLVMPIFGMLLHLIS